MGVFATIGFMWMKIWYLILRILGKIQNHTTNPEDELTPSLEELHEEALEKQDEALEDRRIATEAPEVVEPPPPSLDKEIGVLSILKESFDGPLSTIPLTRYGARGVYTIYGRAPEETTNTQYPKAKMLIATGLPGRWNNSSGRLYVLAFMEPYLREALRRCGVLGVLEYFDKLGAYVHRQVRFDESAPLSLHSWGCAVDFNTSDNIVRYLSPTWKNASRVVIPGPSLVARYGPIPPPYSKIWKSLWPKGVPYKAVLAFKSVGFEWGGDWGRSKWEKLVEVYGEGYEESDLDYSQSWVKEAVDEWKTISFIDPMHVQLKWERDRPGFKV
jgi:hypothetical protein